MQASGVRARSGHSYRTLEQLAAGVRSSLNVQECEPFPGVELFESLEDYEITWRDEQIALDSHVFEAGTDDAGLTWFDVENMEIVVSLDEDTYRSLIVGEGRARFSFAHELIHAFVHTGELIGRALKSGESPSVDIALHRKVVNHRIFRDTEWQANGGASALLMPAVGLYEIEKHDPQLSVESIQQFFGTSRQAAQYRRAEYLKRRGELLGVKVSA